MHAQRAAIRTKGRLARVATALVLAVIALSAEGQSSNPATERVLTSDNITEASLIDALIPHPVPHGFTRVSPSASLLIEFETSSTALTGEAKQLLNVLGRALNSEKLADYKFIVEGHADRRGRPDLNQKLSEQRAAAVREYLVQQQKVGEHRLEAIGKGDREPKDRRHPAAPINRRVTFITKG